MADKANVLVVANRTAESPELLSALRARHQEGPVEYTLLVPATPQGVSWAADMHAGGEEADEHLSHLDGQPAPRGGGGDRSDGR